METARSTLLSALLERRTASPSQVFATFRGEEREVELTWGRFFDEAARYAAFLDASAVSPRETVFILAPLGPHTLTAFAGAMLARAIPALLSYPSSKVAPAIYARNLRGVLETTGARIVLATRELEGSLGDVLATMKGDRRLLWLEDAPSLEPEKVAERARLAESIPPEEVAFLQHSSGTTGLQKGVALSHAAVLNQVRHYRRALALTEHDRIASWLPLYHDMGLIATFLMPLVTGTPVAYLDPFRWVVDPALLLEAIDRHRATLSWLPNFAYQHLAKRIPVERSEKLDLSCVRGFINCSEPVRHAAHRAFLERFAPNGVKEEMLWVCYAMAENTFAVTQAGPTAAGVVDWVDPRELATNRRASPLESGIPIVSCGAPIEGCAVRIVDERRQPLPERSVGEVALRSDSMLTEYHRNPAATQAALEGGFYFTGDLGYLASGQLYITGRKKDLIIVGGRNFHPQDLEDVASEQDGVVPGRVAALGVDNSELGTQEVVLVAETELTESGALSALKRTIQRVVLERLDCAVSRIELVERGWLIKTSSGKVARSANLEKYLVERARAERTRPAAVVSPAKAIAAPPFVDPPAPAEGALSLVLKVAFTVLVLVLAVAFRPNQILILYRGF